MSDYMDYPFVCDEKTGTRCLKQCEVCKRFEGSDRFQRQPVYCHKCSSAGGADRPIYHLPPACK